MGEVERETKSCAQDSLLWGGVLLDNEQHGGRPKSGDLGGTTELVPSENMGTVWIMDG